MRKKRLREDQKKIITNAFQWLFDHEGEYDFTDCEAEQYAEIFLSKHKDL